jgi:DNA-binding winged helix-turn-helix (wHTH) protein
MLASPLRATIARVIYRFDDYELDEGTGELRRGGARVEIQPKPLELLALLVRERARVVPSDELMRALWPGVAVTPSSLTRAVSLARRAIGDTHRASRIQSAARRGYRFVAEVRELPARAPAGAPAAALDASGAAPFVGREPAFAELRAAFEAACAGAGQIVLVSGRAGIGKTRLVETFARECERAGARALEARCRDREGAPAFWMWGQLLRRIGADDPDAPALRELQRLSAELGLAGAGDAQRSASRSPEQTRFLFFEAASDVLREAASRAPLVIVLEDVQWAASESLRMLEHVAHELARARLLLIATVREEPAAPAGPLDRTLAALRQLERCRAIELRAFSRREVGELLALAIGRPAPPDLTTELAAHTEGVPLFLREAIRALKASGELDHPERLAARALPIAEKSLQLLQRSLRALPERCLALLEAGAVLGREFALPIAADVCAFAREDAAEALDSAFSASVVEPVRGRASSWRFAHALYREAVYEGIAPGRRARLHLRAAERIEQRAAPDPSRALSELSYHHFEALAVGDAARAMHFAERAAEQSSARLAWAEAATHWTRAVAAAEHVPAPAARKLELLLRLGEAHALARDPEGRRSALREAFALATSLGRSAEQIRAAVLYCDLSEWSPSDPDAEPLLRAALDAAPAADSHARAQLLTRLAYRRVRANGPAAAAIAREALPLARASGDPQQIQEAAYVLLFALAGPDQLAERAALRDEIERAALATPQRDTGLIALLDLACDRLMLGDAAAARELRRAAGVLAGESPHPGLRWHLTTYDAGLAALEGRLDESEMLARDAVVAGRRARHPYAQGCFDIQRVLIAFERGDAQLAVDVFERFTARDPGSWGVPIHWIVALVARARLALGQREAAAALWRRLAEPGFAAVPRNIRWTRSLAEIAHLCADLGDAERAPELIALLEPVADQHGVIPIPVAYGGPLRYALARLYDLSGRPVLAQQSLTEAITRCDRLGATSWSARLKVEASRRR